MSKKAKRRRAQTQTRDGFEEVSRRKARQMDRRLQRKIKEWELEQVFASLT